MWTIVKRDLNLFPYKIQVHQQLKDVDVNRRLDFANLMLEKIENKEIDISKIWFSDEAHFHLNGYVNKQNYRHWGTEPPHLAISKPAHPLRLTVWCGMSSSVIIGPVFIDGNVTGSKYQGLLEKDFFPKIRRYRLVQDHWFQQDGARPHRTDNVLQSLASVFGGRIIGLDSEKVTDSGIDWPPNSPDLNPCDFFLWGHIKDRVYRTAPKTLEDLKLAIRREVTAIQSQVLESVIRNFETRLHHLVVGGGEHFENLIH